MALTAPTADLTGNTIADTYDQILILDSTAGVVENTLKVVSTQTGKSALQIDDEKVLIKGVDTSNALAFEVQEGADATSYIAIGTGATTKGVTINESGQADIDFRVEGSSVPYALFVDGTNGNVGIGTDTPNYKLDIAGTGNDETRILHVKGTASSHATASGGYLWLSCDDGNVMADTHQLGRIDFLGADSSSAAAGLNTQDEGASIYAVAAGAWDGDTNAANLHFATAPTDNSNSYPASRISILHNGNVGIGTTSPGSLLTINAATGGIMEMRREDDNNIIGTGDVLGSVYFTGDDPTDNTFEPGAQISAIANGGWTADNHPSRLDFFVNTGSSSSAITSFLKMRIDNLGNVLMGASAVAASGNTALCILNGNDPVSATTNTACIFASGGSMYLTNAAGDSGTIDSTSDDRMKDNITVIPDSLSRLASLKGITFNYVSYKDGTLPFKGDIADDVEFGPYKIWGDDTRVGVIAQDVETAYDGLNITNAVMEVPVEASPEADTPEIYGEVKTVRVETLVPLLIEAVKELSAKVTALENA